MPKQKIIKITSWYRREVCATCGKLFPEFHMYEVCPKCGQSGLFDCSYAKTKEIVLRRASVQRGYLPWRRYDVYEGKDEFTKQWLKENERVQINP